MSAPRMFARYRIGGEWVDSEKRMESISPANGETIGTEAVKIATKLGGMK